MKKLISISSVLLLMIVLVSPGCNRVEDISLYDLLKKIEEDPSYLETAKGKKFNLTNMFVDRFEKVVVEKSNKLEDQNKINPSASIYVIPYTTVNDKVIILNDGFVVMSSSDDVPAPAELVDTRGKNYSIQIELYDNSFDLKKLSTQLKPEFYYESDVEEILGYDISLRDSSFFRTSINLNECELSYYDGATEGLDAEKKKIYKQIAGDRILVTFKCNKVQSTMDLPSSRRSFIEKYFDYTNDYDKHYGGDQGQYKLKEIKKDMPLNSDSIVTNEEYSSTDGKFNKDSLASDQPTSKIYYNGCGYSYESKEDCITQCAAFNGSKCAEGEASGKIIKASK
jgi:hypothetical protein